MDRNRSKPLDHSCYKEQEISALVKSANELTTNQAVLVVEIREIKTSLIQWHSDTQATSKEQFDRINRSAINIASLTADVAIIKTKVLNGDFRLDNERKKENANLGFFQLLSSLKHSHLGILLLGGGVLTYAGLQLLALFFHDIGTAIEKLIGR